MDKQGLVAPVWSDAGEPKVTHYDMNIRDVLFSWTGGVQVKHQYSFEGIQWPTFDFTQPKVSTAKDALPAAYKTQPKRGPGWCDE